VFGLGPAYAHYGGMSKWNLTSEQLPEVAQKVVVFTTTNKAYEAVWCSPDEHSQLGYWVIDYTSYPVNSFDMWVIPGPPPPNFDLLVYLGDRK